MPPTSGAGFQPNFALFHHASSIKHKLTAWAHSGANFVHGQSPTNPVSKLVEETQSVLHTLGESQAGFSSSGKPLDQDFVTRTSDSFWSIIADAFEYSNNHSEKIPSEKSLLDFIKEKVDEKYPVHERDKAPEDSIRPNGRAARNDSADAERKLILSQAEAWGGFVGSPTSRQSLRFFWLEECIEGENPFMASTYRKVLQKIAAPALSGARLLLDHCVSKVRSGHESANGEETQGGRVLVEAVNKKFVESFDEAIITLPLGYLQKHKADLFQPRLGAGLDRAIQAVGYGNLDKARDFPSSPKPYLHKSLLLFVWLCCY